jgi:hypothetical protein
MLQGNISRNEEIATDTATFSSHHPDQSAAINQLRGKTLHQSKEYDSLKAQIMVGIFSNL